MTIPTRQLMTPPSQSSDEAATRPLASGAQTRRNRTRAGVATLLLLISSGCSSDSSGDRPSVGSATDSGAGGAEDGGAGDMAEAGGGAGGDLSDAGEPMPTDDAGAPEPVGDSGVDGADAGSSDAGSSADAGGQDSGTDMPDPADAGNTDDAGGPMFFDSKRAYDRLNPDYATPEECVFNCYQKLEFCPDGNMYIVVTDIVYPGNYSLSGDTVSISLPNGELFEISGDFDFVFQETDSLLGSDLGPRVWDRSKNVDPFFCGQFE